MTAQPSAVSRVLRKAGLDRYDPRALTSSRGYQVESGWHGVYVRYRDDKAPDAASAASPAWRTMRAALLGRYATVLGDAGYRVQFSAARLIVTRPDPEETP
jgi:hypothetical protein